MAAEMTWLKMLIMRQQKNNRPTDCSSVFASAAATDKDKLYHKDCLRNNSLQTKEDEKVRRPTRDTTRTKTVATNNFGKPQDQNQVLEEEENNSRLPELVREQEVTSHRLIVDANQQVKKPNERMEFGRTRNESNKMNSTSKSRDEDTTTLITSLSAHTTHKHNSRHHTMPAATLAISTLIVSLIAQQLLGPSARVVVTAAAAASSGRQSFATQPEPRYLVAAGQQVRLPCFVSNRQGKCAWLGPGQQIITSGKRYVFAELPSDGDCSLVIKRADVTNDDGFWQCQALADDEKLDTAPLIRSRPSQLVVLLPPERPRINDLSKGNNKLILEETQEKNVTCEIRGGNPAPQIEWYLDGKLVVQNVDSVSPPNAAAGEPRDRLVQSRLLLANMKRALNGKNLTCLGVHQMANQSTSIELDVHYLPIVSVPQTEVTLIEGSPLSVICQVDANPAATHVFWKLVNSDANEKETSSSGGGLFAQLSGAAASSSSSANNKEALMTSTQGPLLEMPKITRIYNRNSYQCLAQNSVGVSQPVDVRLNILYPPQAMNTTENTHVQAGTNYQLVCAFDGNPQPEVKWHYMDPLARTPAMLAVDNTRDQSVDHATDKAHAKSRALLMQQFLNIKNVTFRNEGDYVCEARNTINGHTNLVRSAVMSLNVYGEPQFLVKSPVPAKAVQGSKSDISLTFCSDPAPTKVYWQFGSNQMPVSLSAGSQQEPRVVLPSRGGGSGAGQTSSRAHHQHAHAMHAQQRFQAQTLQPLQRRDSQFSRSPTCFEAALSLLDPEMNDARDYTLIVQNELGLAAGYVRLRVASPLSPALMITSAFVFIFVLFLCALLVLFFFKKRQQFFGGRRTTTTGVVALETGSQPTANGSKRRSRRDKNLLVGSGGGGGANGELTNGQLKQAANGTGQTTIGGANGNGAHQQQTNGVVNGLGNGLANGASNPAAGLEQLAAVVDNEQHHRMDTKGMMSMASSDTSCNDQKQLLASSSCSDRNSSSGGSSNGAVTVSSGTEEYRHHHRHSTASDDRSTANSTPSPMNHISVDDELQLNGTYQATESITSGAPLAHSLNGASALIYANIDYARKQQQRPAADDQDHVGLHDNIRYHGHSPSDSMSLNSRRAYAHQQVSPDSSEATTVQESGLARQGSSTRRRQQQQQLNLDGQAASPDGLSITNNRPSVGATIAMMNSLAAAQAAAMNSPTGIAGAPQTGVLNGAINQQLMANSANRQVRKPGPPKPPKPSIQQRSRFYQQQAAAAAAANAANGGLVMIGSSQMGQQYSTPAQLSDTRGGISTGQDGDNTTPLPNHDLAVEYSRLAFPARAEL